MRIGMLIAVEVAAFISTYAGQYQKEVVSGFDVYVVKAEGMEIFAIHSGAGQVFAAAATMLLVDRFKVELIVNYGVVGGLTTAVETYDKCIVDKVVHYNFDTSEVDHCEVGRHLEYDSIYMPTDQKLLALALSIDDGLRVVTCASGDKFVGSAAEKAAINRQFGADICEMEAAAIVMIADRAKVPCLLIKTVSDSIVGGPAEFRDTVQSSSKLCLDIVKKILDNSVV